MMIEEALIDVFALKIIRSSSGGAVITWEMNEKAFKPTVRRAELRFYTACPGCGTELGFPLIMKWTAGFQPTRQELFERFEATLKDRGVCPVCKTAVDRLLLSPRVYQRKEVDDQ